MQEYDYARTRQRSKYGNLSKFLDKFGCCIPCHTMRSKFRQTMTVTNGSQSDVCAARPRQPRLPANTLPLPFSPPRAVADCRWEI